MESSDYAERVTVYATQVQLLCGSCNSLKGDRPQEELLAKLTDKGWIKTKVNE